MEAEVLNQVLHKLKASERVSIFVKGWGPQADPHGVGQDHHHGPGNAGLTRDANLEINVMNVHLINILP